MEGDAGARRLNPTDELGVSPEQGGDADQPGQDPAEEAVEAAASAARRPSRLGRGWMAATCGVLLIAAGVIAGGGYLAVRSHQESEAFARSDAAAVAAAKDCVAATQALDTAAMTASQTKIFECSTGDFGTQAALYSGVLADAYQAANVTVQVSEMRAAVERHNSDGSVEVLVAVRVKVTNSETADQEQGYRLRAQMAPADGTYKIARLEQVTG